MFNEYDDKARDLEGCFVEALNWIKRTHDINYKNPVPKLARALLNDVQEYKPLEE